MKNVKIYLMVLLLAVVGVGEMWGAEIYYVTATNCTTTLTEGTYTAGSTITFTVTPNSGYYCPETVEGDYEYGVYHWEDSKEAISCIGHNKYSFTMPNRDDVWVFIECKAATSHSVNFNVPACVTSPKGASSEASFPTPTPRVIDGYKFEGWVTSTYNSTTRPSTIYSPGEGIPDGVTTAYALYSSVSATFDKITGTTMPVDGGNYMLCSAYATDARVINNDINDTKHRLQTTAWDMSGSTATCTDWSCIWKFVQGTGTYSSYWFIYNEETNKYLGVTGTGTESADDRKMQLRDAKDDYTAWSCSVSSGRITLTNKKRSGDTNKILKCSSNDAGIYSGGTVPYFFKQVTASVNYTTSPSCTADTYTVTYAGGSGAIGSVTDGNNYEFENEVTIKSNTSPGFTKAGYNFVGWTCDYRLVTVDGDPDEYLIGETIPAGEVITMPAASITLTAVWEEKTYLYGSSCEPLENITVTYNDAGTTWTRDYGVGTPVTVDSEVGSKGCTDWVFVGWQRGSAVANNSTSYTPVHNFTATAGDDEAVFYAVYDSVGTDWISALNISELKSGAEYVIVKRYAETKHYALTTTVANTNYLTGTLLGTDCETIKDASNNNRYKLKVTPTADMKWEASYVGGYWRLYNKALGEYLNVNTSNYAFTSTTYDEFTAADGYNNSEIKIQDRGDSKYLYWYNGGPYWEGYGGAGVFGMHTNAQKFTSTPPCSPRSVTFYGNGGTVSDGVNSGANLVVTEASRDAGITTPTASFTDCNGKSWNFVGWIDREVDVTRVPVLTTDMIEDGGGNKHHNITSNGEEYWAVYTNTGTPETKYGTINITASDVAGEYREALTFTKNVAETDFGFEFYHVGNQSTLGIQFDYNIATRGYIKNTTSLGKINSISFSSFGTGSISSVQVYVGNSPETCTTLLTAAELQTVGGVSTYYPKNNYAYLKIQATAYVGIGTISIDFGKGTQVWATTPDCSTITLSGDVRVTSTASKTVKGVTALTVNARQLKANTALSFAAYNVADDTPNTHFGFDGSVSADASGLVTDQTIVVTYTPAADATTDGIEDVYFKATALADDDVTTTESNKQAGYGRHLPANFVIAAKASNEWVALTAKISMMSTQDAIPIKVDNTTTPTKASVALNTCEYSLLGLPNTNSRYATNGTAVHLLSSQTSKVLNATKNISAKTYLNTGATATNAASSDSCLFYEWKLVSSDLVHYTVTNSNELPSLASNRILGYSTASGKWGMYASGSGTNQDIFLLPIETVITDMEAEVMEWGTTSMVLRIAGTAPSNVNITLGGTPSGSKAMTAIAAGSDLYKVEGLTLTGSNCEVMMIADAADASKGTLVRKPILVSGEATGSTYTSAPGRDVCANCDIVILNGGKLTADEAKTTGSHVDFANIYVYPGGKLVLDAKSLGVKQQVYVRGGYSWLNTNTYALPELYLNGNINFNGSGKIIYDYYIQNYKYYQFSLPYTVPLAKVTDEAGVDNFPVWVKHYNGALRAANAQATSWEWYEGENFEAGIGYIIAARPRQVDKVQNRPLSIIRFPLTNNAFTGNSTADYGEATKSVSTTAHGITGYGAGTVTANNVGWNFVGNPYMATWKGDIGHQQLEKDPDAEHWNGSYHWADGTTKYITVMSPEDGTDYDQYVASTTELKPFFPFYFQETAEGGNGTLTFTLGNRIKKAPAAVSADAPREAFVQIDMMDGTSQDQTGVYVGDKYSDELDFDDMQKMFGSLTTKPKIWIMHDETRMAFEAMSEERAAGNVPVGYRAPVEGEYTFALSNYSELDDVESVLLNDNELGVYNYNLLNSDYEFESGTVLYNDTRFTLRIVLKDENTETPTGTETIYLNSEEPSKFIYHDKMYILRGGVIYDATGKKVGEINK